MPGLPLNNSESVYGIETQVNIIFISSKNGFGGEIHLGLKESTLLLEKKIHQIEQHVHQNSTKTSNMQISRD